MCDDGIFISVYILYGCGDNKKSNTPQTDANVSAPSETKDSEPKADTQTDGETVSDETFETLQNNYAVMVECHDAVAELYNSEEIAANPDIEDAMSQAYEIIEQMGEITQDTLSENDAIELNDAMGKIIEVLSAIVDEMEPAEGADNEMVSDETFALLQENYELLSGLYNTVAEAYNSNEGAADPEIEDTMNQAYDLIEQMGNITNENITEEDAAALAELMAGIAVVLQEVADAM